MLRNHLEGGARRPTRPFSPRLSPLEDRQLLSAAPAPGGPTPAEQYMLELVNRARSNPQAEARRLLAAEQSDPALSNVLAYLGPNGFEGVLGAYKPLPPLAFNDRLISAARAHDSAMLAANDQVHSAQGFLTDATVAHAADGRAYYPTGAASWATGENIYANTGSPNPSATAEVDYLEAAFLIDWGNPSFGHLKNIMAPGPGAGVSGGHPPFTEIGIGIMTDATPTTPSPTGVDVGPVLVTQEFGWRQGNAFLTGVAYTDASSDHFYKPGEGLGGATITAVGRNQQGTFRVQTWASGGYSLQLPPGTYTVTATGNVPAPRSAVVTIGQDNVGWDIACGKSVPQPPAVPVPRPSHAVAVPHPVLKLTHPAPTLARPVAPHQPIRITPHLAFSGAARPSITFSRSRPTR